MTTTECIDAVNEAFKEVGILRSTSESLATVALPASSKQFLLQGGLPRGRPFGFDFEPVQTLPTIGTYAAASGYSSMRGDPADARCIGDSSGALLFLDVREWTVRWINTGGGDAEMFVNTNVESLGACLAAYATLTRLREDVPRTELSARFAQMLLRIDPPCVEGWWSTVVQEIEFGLS